MSKRLAIVGGGPGGLAAARAFLSNTEDFNVVLFEADHDIGGVWNYHENDKDGKVMYDQLETNISKELMQFSDFPFEDSVPHYPRRIEVWQYLKQYYKKFIDGNERFTLNLDTRVVTVKKDQDSWTVTVKHGKEVEQHRYDYVIIATGHFSTPAIPQDVPGLQEWFENNAAFHSKDFQNCEFARDKTVIVVGNGSSGQDICIQTFTRAKRLFNSVPDTCLQEVEKLPHSKHVEIVPKIVKADWTQKTVELANGDKISNVDFLVYATGYLYDLSYLDEELRKDLMNGSAVTETCTTRLHNLWKQIFYVKDSTLAFSLLCQLIVPFPAAESQAAVMVKSFTGQIQVPTTPDTENSDKYHALAGGSDVDYYRDLQSLLDQSDCQNDRMKPVQWDEHRKTLRSHSAEDKRQRNIKLVQHASELKSQNKPYCLLSQG